MLVNVGDMQTFFGASIIKVKGDLRYVGGIHAKRGGREDNLFVAEVKNPKTQKFEEMILGFNDFQNVTERLGFVNAQGSAAYWTRFTARQFGIGLKRQNTHLTALHRNADQFEDFSSGVHLDTLKGDYPTFKQALTMIEEGATCVAFDRQFAIMFDKSVYYRTKNVGLVKNNAKTVADIAFDREYKYLETIVGGDYEKNLRNFVEKAKKG